MRHFLVRDQIDDEPNVHENISQYVENIFKSEGESWPIFSFENVVKDERFSHVSL